MDDVDLAEVAALAVASSTEPALNDTDDLPFPAWWKGECNSGVSRGAKPLGASFRGVPACGPQPGRSDGRLVFFFPGAWGEYEWQCTELVYRFMYLAYGVRPYVGNGDQVVDKPVKVSGTVQAGSLKAAGAGDRFVLADHDSGKTLPVAFDGALSDEIAEGSSLVITGSLSADGRFTATDVALEG